jgi:hypothetical protein
MMYTNAVSVVQINGYRSGPITISCSIRQRCTISTVLFELCINPLIHSLEKNLQGMRLNKGQRKVAVMSYTDITILLTTKEDVEVLKEIIQCYERATGALLNLRKSQALAVRPLDSTISVLGIPYSKTIKILGFQMKQHRHLPTVQLVECNGKGEAAST